MDKDYQSENNKIQDAYTLHVTSWTSDIEQYYKEFFMRIILYHIFILLTHNTQPYNFPVPLHLLHQPFVQFGQATRLLVNGLM